VVVVGATSLKISQQIEGQLAVVLGVIDLLRFSLWLSRVAVLLLVRKSPRLATLGHVH